MTVLLTIRKKKGIPYFNWYWLDKLNPIRRINAIVLISYFIVVVESMPLS